MAVDILPDPLYTLVAVLERFKSLPDEVELVWAHAWTADLQAVLRAGEVTGRLSVTLRGRPVASSLTCIHARIARVRLRPVDCRRRSK
jgi:hypothetical protein